MNGLEFLKNTEVGDPNRAITESLFGFKNIREIPILPKSKDYIAKIFFTRPQLNLTKKNLFNVPSMYDLLTDQRLSMWRWARVTLDPRLPLPLMINGKEDFLYDNEIVDTPLVDNQNPFIPILSNTIKNLSGIPDIFAPKFTSSNGLRKEQFSMIDGITDIYYEYDIDVTFRNFLNEPITMLFQAWLKYASYVFEGKLYPYIDFIAENEIDYNTRIYIFVTDVTGRYIKKAFCTGISFPYTVPTGKFFDFDISRTYSDQTEDINIRLACNGGYINDPRIFMDFNKLMAVFHPDIRNYMNGKQDAIVEIPPKILEEYNIKAYPFIDLNTYEFKWVLGENDSELDKIKNLINTSEGKEEKNETFEKDMNDFLNM